MEFSDDSIRSSKSLAEATSYPVLAVIPQIVTQKEHSRTRKKQIALVTGFLSSLAITLALFHLLYMDLYIFWAKLMRKMAF